MVTTKIAKLEGLARPCLDTSGFVLNLVRREAV